jgi:hypothetical protein
METRTVDQQTTAYSLVYSGVSVTETSENSSIKFSQLEHIKINRIYIVIIYTYIIFLSFRFRLN